MLTICDSKKGVCVCDWSDKSYSVWVVMEVLALIACVTLALVTLLAVLIAWDVRAKRVYKNQPLLLGFRHYLGIQALRLVGRLFRERLLRSTKNVAQVQSDFLLNQLQENADTEYGKKYGFRSMTCVEDFQNTHPLTYYNHYAPYVERMMEGEEQVLTKKQPEMFGVSSGTSGASKIIPMLKQQKGLFFKHAVSVLYCCLVEAFPQVNSRLRKSLKIFYNPVWRTSKAGIKIGPNSSSPSSQKHLLHMYSTPEVGFDILDEPCALYVHILFALKDRHLGMIEGNFASLIYNAMVTLHKSLPQLLSDIREGTLNHKLNINSNIREQLETLLQPDPDRAEEIRQAFEKGVTGVCKRIWPELGVVLTVDSGAFASYAEKLRSTYCEGVPIYSAVYAATEGLIGVNMWPQQLPSRYLPHPAVHFFEFIPHQHSASDQPDTLLLHQLKEGEEYELVVTNVSGLYRYRLGDVVRVTGFHNQCPILEFLYRIGQFLNVRGEKTSEALFYDALCQAVEQWSGLTLVDYCCAESILVDDDDCDTESESYAPSYHVFLELDGTMVLSQDQKCMIDAELCEKSYVYSSFRKKGSIDVTKVHLLRHGAFQEFRTHVINTTDASSNQFKVPRVLKRRSFVEFLTNMEI